MEFEQKTNILLVDDKLANLLALEAVLDEPGYNLVRAQSGNETLRHLLDQDFALILLDVQMSDMNGFQTAEMIRKREKSRDVPIIFLSAEYKTTDHITQGYNLNAIDYILKPFDAEILKAKVAVLIDLHRKTVEVKRQAELLRESGKQLEKLVQERTTELNEANRQLRQDIIKRKKVEEALQKARDELERRVKERTAELTETNKKLRAEITQRKQAEEKLKETTADLTRSNNDLEQFAYVASHDLQEPLRMVSSFVSLLANRYKDKLDSDAEQFIAYAVGGAKRMQELINDLLAFSRVGTRGKPFESTDCASVMDQVVVSLQRTIEEGGAEITYKALPTVMADFSQMVQLFQNLIGNAIKFRDKKPSRVRVSAEKRENEWVFSVRDNGIGLDSQYFERIFVIFQRLHAREEYPGTGIGLAICKKVVERHGGRIWCESQLGKGSTFYFTIPVKE